MPLSQRDRARLGLYAGDFLQTILLDRAMIRTVPSWPLDLSDVESKAGFHRMALCLGNFVGAYPGDCIQVVARKLSDCDVLIKVRSTTRQGKPQVWYRHLRFGYPSLREKVRIFCDGIRFGWWTAWLGGSSPWKVDWQHVPFGDYDSLTDDFSRTLCFSSIVGTPFREYKV